MAAFHFTEVKPSMTGMTAGFLAAAGVAGVELLVESGMCFLTTQGAVQ
jgi:hypothetical protein